MGNNFETFILAYQAAPQPIKDIIDSDAIGTFVDTLLSTHALPESHKRAFLVIVSNRLLAITSNTDVATALQSLGITTPVVEKIGALIKAFIQSHIDGVVTAAVTKEATTAPIQSTVVAVPTISPAPISRVRTMASDMSKTQTDSEVIHSSSQATLLREATQIPPVLKPKPTEGSWG